jgi:hypothetical protein
MGFCLFVLTASSRRDQPKLFMLSLKEEEAMMVGRWRLGCAVAGRARAVESCAFPWEGVCVLGSEV